MNIVKRISLTISCSLLINFEAGYADGNKPDSIKVGVIQSLSGIAAEDGKTVVQALKLAADDINSKGQIKLELLIEDDGTQPKNSVAALKSLIQQQVQVVIGATWDFTTNAILSVLSIMPIKGPLVFNTSTLPESISLSPLNGYGFFINAITAADEAAVFNDFLAKRKANKMAVVFANNSWGETQLKAYKDIATKHGVAVVYEGRSSSYDTNEWNTFVSRIKQKKVDIVVLLLNKNDLEVFLRRAGELGLKSSFFASKNLFDALRSSTSKETFNGTCFTYPLDRLEKEVDFRSRYRSAFGEDARIYADNTYDALFIIARAAEDSKKRGIALQDALRSVKYDGVVGRYEFSEAKSFSTGNSSLVCVHNGEARLEK